MIPDVGAPGKWRYPGIGKLKQGDLTSLGYNTSDKAATRHRAVDRAIKKYGRLSTLRKLNAVAVYTRRTSPAKSRIFKADMKYVQKNK
jgi:hypothetical protein